MTNALSCSTLYFRSMLYFRGLLLSLLLLSLTLGSKSQQIPLKKTQVTEKISMMVPEEFIPMSPQDIRNKFISYRDPIAGYTSQDRSVDLVVNVSKTPWSNQDLELLKAFYENNIRNLFDDVEFQKNQLEAINGRRYAVFEFTSTVQGDPNSLRNKAPVHDYRYMLYTVRILVFTFLPFIVLPDLRTAGKLQPLTSCRTLCSTSPMDFSVFSDEHYMKLAYKEAIKAKDQGEIPVGALVVCGNTIVAKSHNQAELLQDVTAHAEILAITAAANYLGAKYLTECTLFVTLEPCHMCAGAIFWSQLQRLVFAASDPARGYTNYSKSKGNSNSKSKSMGDGEGLLHPRTEVVSGLLAEPCAQLIEDFFRELRN